jgi:hypothetical protein
MQNTDVDLELPELVGIDPVIITICMIFSKNQEA